MKTAIVTGASSGIGKSIAIDLAKQNYQLLLIARNKERLEALARELPTPNHYFCVDLSQPEAIKAFLDNLKHSDFKEFTQSLKLVVNNAGIFTRKTFNESSLEEWHQQFQTNLFAPVQLTKGLFEYLKQQTSSQVINISSSLGIRPVPETSAYSSNKAAMINWTQTLALEWAPYNVRVNCIAPGLVNTPIHNLDSLNPEEHKQRLKMMDQMQPIGRVGSPDDVVETVKYFCTSSWSTGTTITIDGGISL